MLSILFNMTVLLIVGCSVKKNINNDIYTCPIINISQNDYVFNIENYKKALDKAKLINDSKNYYYESTVITHTDSSVVLLSQNAIPILGYDNYDDYCNNNALATIGSGLSTELAIKKKKNYTQLCIPVDYFKIYHSKKYGNDIIYVYDSIGRLIKKHESYSNEAEIGEEILFFYNDDQSRNPIVKRKTNHDKKYPICWKQALNIAQRKGLKFNDIRIKGPDYYPEKSSKTWIISNNKYIIKIDAYTGKPSKRKKKKTRVVISN